MDLSRYAELFLTESREHLSAINHLLLELERTPGAAEPVVAIFRAVHTVKGMSATMGYQAVADLAHEMEAVLDLVRCGELQLTAESMDAFFAAADALESAVELSVAGRAEEVSVGLLLDELRALRVGVGLADAASGTTEPPAARESEPVHRTWLARVTLVDGVALKGARAFLVIRRAESLGAVSAVAPTLDELEAERFDREFTLRVESGAEPDVIERALRSAGDVEAVELELARGRSDDEKRAATARSGARETRHIRIDLRRLDNLMNLIGELVITRGRLAEIAKQVASPALDDTLAQATRLISDLQDEIMSSRLVPVWQVFDRFPRLVRDAARGLGKEVELVVHGKDIELDRSMLDEIGDPVVHLLRNAIDHGIETPAERVAAGKPRVARLTLSATRERSSVTVRVHDDGRGIDRAKVLRKARDLGLVDTTKSDLSDDELMRLIARPGFSTAERVTDISGRGVGIDAVNSRVRALGGSVEIRTSTGQGTGVSVRLPVTLAIVRALLARVDDETYAVPMTHVNETVQLEQGALKTVRGHEVLMMREDVLPLIRFRKLLALPARTGATPQVIVLEIGERRAGLVVDELTGQQDVVVKQFDAVRGATLFSGATILGDGAPALIVDVGSLL